jgi:CTP-dependent riboflavin kinase
MTDLNWVRVKGIIVPGYQVASGRGADSPYPHSTIEMQIPFFKQLGLDLTPYFRGTLNISIRPKTFTIVRPEFTFRAVAWTDRHPPEDFSFSRCRVSVQEVSYDGWVYYPHPETKKRNFQDPTLIEVIAPFIPRIQYGLEIELETNPLEIRIDQG